MTRKVRCGLMAAASAFAFVVTASSPAAAAVSLNGGPITLTATARTPSLIESTGSAITINCAGSIIRGNVLSDGTGTITTGNATFATCLITGGGAVTFTHLGNWTISTAFLLSGGRIVGVQATLTLPSGTAQITYGACTFQLAGTAVSLQALTATTPPALVSINALPFTSLALTLTVVNASAGCSGTGIANGDQARINAAYALSSTLTGTLVP